MKAPLRTLFIIAMSVTLALVGSWTPANATGNNSEGDVKIHEGSIEPTIEPANDPHVCTFHVHGLSFEAGQQVEWWVEKHEGNNSPRVISTQNATTDLSGDFVTSVWDLPNEHYKLYWQLGPTGTIKHKTFWSDCAAPPTTGALTVTKYNDLDADGERDAAEGILSGWTFSVKDASNATVGTLTTDGTGTATLSDLAPGAYSVIETAQAGWVNSDPGGGTITGISVVAGQTATATFGNYQIRALLLTSMCSVDPNLTREGRVRNSNPDAVPFTWEVYGTAQHGTGTAAANADVFFTTLTVSGPNTTKIYWSGGETVKASGGAACAPLTGTLSVIKYNDVDGDGQRDAGEDPLSGWTFTAKDASGATVGTMVTDVEGTDSLTLPAGTYAIVETAQSGWTNTQPTGGTVNGLVVEVGKTTNATFGNYQIQKLTLTSMCSVDPSQTREWRVRNPNPLSVPFTWEVYGTTQHGTGTALANADVFFTTQTVSGPNTTKIYWNGGETVKASGGAACAPQTGSLSVFKYNDLDNDGERALPSGSAGEPGLSGWSFIVTRIDDALSFQAAQTWDLVTGTDALGYSEAVSLAPGTYRVCEDTPLATGWTNTDPGDGYCKTVELAAGAKLTVAFGNHYYTPPTPQGGVLTITKYNDLDRDGARDAGEPGLEGWTFEIRSGGSVFATLATGSLGTAAMSVGAGTYTVTEVHVPGWTNTDPTGESASKTVTIVDGQTTYVAFGNARVIIPSTRQTQLLVFKYNDVNRSGKSDDDEVGLAGFTFLVHDASGATIATLVTAASGYASITNLPLGAYTIVEQPRSGWTNTDPGGAGQKWVVLTSTATMIEVQFGNAEVRLPSTSTGEPVSSSLWTLLLASAFLPVLEVVRRQRRS